MIIFHGFTSPKRQGPGSEAPSPHHSLFNDITQMAQRLQVSCVKSSMIYCAGISILFRIQHLVIESLKLKRSVYKPLGLVFLALGVIGILLPILPSTPFVLLAAWCFAQSSEKWHRKLLDSDVFGPMIRNWEANRCISLRTKIVGLTGMAVAGGASIAFAINDPVLQIAAASLMGVGAATLLLLKTCPECRNPESNRHS